jgi:hypothetical protein
MKIKPEDKEYLKKGIQDLINGYGMEYVKKHKESLKQDTRVKDLATRFAWDLFWGAKFKDNGRHLYSYLNDNHITTALKRIVKEIGV